MPSDPGPNPTPTPGKPRRRPSTSFGNSWIWMMILLFLAGAIIVNSWNSGGTVDYSDFYRFVSDERKITTTSDEKYNDNIVRVTAEGSDRYTVEVADPAKLPDYLKDKVKRKQFTVQRLHFNNDKEEALLLKLAERKDPGPVKLNQETDSFATLLLLLLILGPIALLLIVFLFLLPRFRDPLGGGFLSNYIKSPAKRYERSKMRMTFDDVAGMQNANSELQEAVEFLRSPEKFQRLGAVVPKGVLLVGPPGTGKTLLAKAVAGEAGVPFFSISGSEFIQMFVGVGASRVRDMFKTAKENAPCILFIDEIDAVGRMRGAGVGGGSDEREQTLNQILSEMDGFTPSESVIVMAATNRPDVLASALLRPGRFDRHITIARPTWQGRLAILKVHTRSKPLADDVNLEAVARSMIGMTGADLRNLANEAALLATREGKSKLDRIDFERAAD